MLLTISLEPSSGLYSGTFYDGPDGIDDFSFTATSLGECFEKVIAFSAVNSLDYREA
jgi:hypothetical protein